MKKQFATLLTGIFLIQTSLFGYNLEVNTSYDYYRGLQDGSWNGNSGAFVLGNFGTDLYDCVGVQLGGSYGLYNWDGRQNLVFKNPKSIQQQAFVTAGVSSSLCQFNAGVAYDRQFTKHFSIYDLSPSIDQLRFQGGYQFCSDEIGVWGTVNLTTCHKKALGVPVSFRAISQMNLFWSHFFQNCAMSTLWIGAPYTHSLRYPHKTAGVVTAGFSVRAPLGDCLFVDAHGSYMRARKTSGATQSRNYDANVCVGITYLFGGKCSNYCSTYMPVANNSNFLSDININN